MKPTATSDDWASRAAGTRGRRPGLWLLGLALVLALGACGTKPTRTVAVEDRPIRGVTAAPARTATAGAPPASAVASPVEPTPSTRPGTYVVKPGDTLLRIALDHGQNWRDIARWNQIENPNLIEVGQVLRVLPEGGSARPVGNRAAETRAVASASGTSAPMREAGRDTPRETGRDTGRDTPREPSGETPRESREAREPREATREAAGDLVWAWPASGPVLQGFDEQRNKGLDIGGKAGDPVFAAADGRVVYAGSALRGYGNLVIVKHNAQFLTAYAHNQALLVKEDQAVRRGQKIAEMGSSDAERVQLHFEIRRDGKPVDPARWLPAR